MQYPCVYDAQQLAREAIAPINRDIYFDMEFFLGSAHAEKNVGGDAASGCNDGVCAFVPKHLRRNHGVEDGTDSSSGDGGAAAGGDGGGIAETELLEFGRNGHTGYVRLNQVGVGSAATDSAGIDGGGGGLPWKRTHEYVAPSGDKWAMDLMFQLGVSKEAAVSVYVVAEPNGAAAATLTTHQSNVAPGTAAELAATLSATTCEVGAADRHFLGRHANGSTLRVGGDASIRM